jgi:hypothetical protein
VNKKQAWRVTGLWARELADGRTILKSKLQLKALIDVIEQVKASGLQNVELEIWPSDRQGEGQPTHSMRITESYKADQAKQDDRSSYPF